MKTYIYNISFWNENELRYDQTQFEVDDDADVLSALSALFVEFRKENHLPPDTTITAIDLYDVEEKEEVQ